MPKNPAPNIRTGDSTVSHPGNKGKPGYPLPDVLKNKIGDVVEKIVSSVSKSDEVKKSDPHDVVKVKKFADLVAKKIVSDLTEDPSIAVSASQWPDNLRGKNQALKMIPTLDIPAGVPLFHGTSDDWADLQHKAMSLSTNKKHTRTYAWDEGSGPNPRIISLKSKTKIDKVISAPAATSREFDTVVYWLNELTDSRDFSELGFGRPGQEAWKKIEALGFNGLYISRINSGGDELILFNPPKFLEIIGQDPVTESKNPDEKEDLGFGFNEDGYPLQDKYEFQGMPIAIENKKGSTRKWYDEDGKEKGSTKMHADYGYVEGATGADGEPVDVYVGNDEKAEYAYVIHQNKAPDFTEYDEDKVMLGFKSSEDAEKLYKKQYNDDKFFAGMSSMPVDKFKEKLQGGGKITNESRLVEANRADMVAAVFCSFKPFHKGHGSMMRDLAKKFSKLVVFVVPDREWTVQRQSDWIEKSAPDIFSKMQVVETQANKMFSALDDAAMDKTSINGDTAITLIVPQGMLADVKQDLTDLAEQAPDDLYWDASAAIAMSYPKFESGDDVGGVSGEEVRAALDEKNIESLKTLLDPHLISNKSDLDSLLGGPKNEAINTHRVDDRDIEDVMQANASLLMKRNINPSTMKMLGSGTKGTAFDMGNNRVFKVTTDKSEAQASMKLKGKNLKHVNNFYDVFKFPPNQIVREELYGIVQDKLIPLTDAEKKELNDAIGWFMDPMLKTSVRPFVERGDWNGALKAMQSAMLRLYVSGKIKEATTTAPARGTAFKPAKDSGGPEISDPREPGKKVDPKIAQRQAAQEYQRVLQIFKKFNVGEMVKEVSSQGIVFIDYHDENVMKRGNQYVINDLGGSDVAGGGDVPVMEALVKRIVSEMGPFTGPGNTRTGMLAGSTKWSSGQAQLDTSVEDTWQNNFNNLPRSGSSDVTEE